MVARPVKTLGTGTEPPLHGIGIFEPTGASAEIVAYVSDAIAEINAVRPLAPGLTHKLAEEILFDRVHSSAVTEGNRLTRRETIVVLAEGLVEAGSRKDHVEGVLPRSGGDPLEMSIRPAWRCATFVEAIAQQNMNTGIPDRPSQTGPSTISTRSAEAFF